MSASHSRQGSNHDRPPGSPGGSTADPQETCSTPGLLLVSTQMEISQSKIRTTTTREASLESVADWCRKPQHAARRRAATLPPLPSPISTRGRTSSVPVMGIGHKDQPIKGSPRDSGT